MMRWTVDGRPVEDQDLRGNKAVPLWSKQATAMRHFMDCLFHDIPVKHLILLFGVRTQSLGPLFIHVHSSHLNFWSELKGFLVEAGFWCGVLVVDSGAMAPIPRLSGATPRPINLTLPDIIPCFVSRTWPTAGARWPYLQLMNSYLHARNLYIRMYECNECASSI